MDIVKNRKVAALITAIIILASILIGAQRSLGKLSKGVTDTFYDGVYLEKEKYTSASIYDALSDRASYSLALITVGANYSALSEETEALRQARYDLLDAMDSKDIGAMYNANAGLETAYTALWDALSASGDVGSRDLSNAQEYVNSLSGAQASISGNQYNAEVSQFRDEVLTAFPVNLLKNVLSLDLPEFYEHED